MWFASLAKVLVLAVSQVAAGDQTPLSWETLPEPIATRQTLFAIPFQLDRVERPEEEPVEVQLFVSSDKGTNWHLYSKVEPRKGYFLFRAGGDGEFWFLIRTLDRNGQLRPRANNRPGLRVIVDTRPPDLTLNASGGEAGQITATWQLNEPNLDPESLKIEYRTAAGEPWQFVAIDRKDIDAPGTTCQGEVTWWCPAAPGRVEIRAEAADKAGNPAVTHAQVNLDRAQVAQSGAAPSSTVNGTSPRNTAKAADTWRTSQVSSNSPAAASVIARLTPVDNQAAATERLDASYDLPADTAATTRPPEASVASQVSPPIRNRFVPTRVPGVARSGDDSEPGVRPRMVNTPTFEIDYDVESAGPSGVARVELWGTRDGGQTWSSFGVDNDGRSPLMVTVGEEGLYGFRVAVETGSGLGGRLPRPGDEPQIWIGVDQTRPQAHFIASEPDPDGLAGRLLIRWQADDAMLARRPVSLFYGVEPDGPWSLVAADLENTGEYRWSFGRPVAQQVYLRLVVRDEAGNQSVVDTHAPVPLEQSRPVVRIRDVRPVDRSAFAPHGTFYYR